MRWRIPLTLVLFAFVAVGCDQAPTAPPADEAVAEAPVFNFSNNDGYLAHGRIFRHPHGVAWWGLDAENGLIALFSTFSGLYCDYGIEGDPVDSQHIFDEFSHLIEQGDVAVQLFDWSAGWDLGDCSLFATHYMGSGTARMVTTDNDVTAYEGNRNRNNAWGFKANGVVDLMGGGTANLNYLFRMTWNADSGFQNVVEKMKLGPDPR